MASTIRIHQDLYGFERKRKGFTTRQLVGMGVGIGICVGVVAITGYVIELPYTIAVSFGLAGAAGPVLAGFAPIWGMPAEVWFGKYTEMNKRGDTLIYQGEAAPKLEGVTNKAYVKAKKQQGFECR